MQYWANINGEQHGPMDLEALKKLDITRTTYIWHEGLPNWVQAQNVVDVWNAINHDDSSSSVDEVADSTSAEPIETSVEVTQEPDNNHQVIVETTVTMNPDDESTSTTQQNTQTQFIQCPFQSAVPNDKQPNNENAPKTCPPTNLVWAILSVVFCCFIPGVISLIYAAQVSAKFNNGEYEKAKKYSDLAAIWCIVSICLCVISLPLYLAYLFI